MQQRVQKIVRAIKDKCGADSVWFDVEQMGGAAQGDGGLNTAMVKGIEQCNTVVVFVSEMYVQRPNCKKEFMYALTRQKRILYVNVGANGWDPKQSMGDEAWLLLEMQDKLWSDCRTDFAMFGPSGLPTLLGAMTKSGESYVYR
jgi:hypothetical protein